MEKPENQRSKILIADDSEMNRAILADMLGDEYDIVEAENGVEAVSVIGSQGTELSLILLDIVMPEMDGFGVLTAMNQNHWIEDIPVIMISAESGVAQVERAYELGATDFITRPFDALIVHKRVVNTILLYAKQKRLMNLVVSQMFEREQQSNMMIEILSHIVEFRNSESGLHVRHVRNLTVLLLEQLDRKNCGYHFSQTDISTIATASAMHDIGKISIPEEILNKPGKLTMEEFEIMKTHTTVGAEMLEKLPDYRDKPLVQISHQICHWHNERYDGRGYPDGLKGDEIPISAQTVALADVYDALTSDRVYKKAIPHEEAIQMILDGQCGAFNPLLLECLSELSEVIQKEVSQDMATEDSRQNALSITAEILQHENLSVSKRTLQLWEHERVKHDFFAALSDEIQFEFTMSPLQVTFSAFGAKKLGFPEVIKDPLHDPGVLSMSKPEAVMRLSDMLRSTSPGQPVVTCDCLLNVNGEERWHRIVARATWSADEPPRYMGAIGKATDIHDDRMKLDDLERQASSDSLTGLLNHTSAKKQIEVRLNERPHGRYALVIFDLDLFKHANDTYGHLFGDELLKYLADKLRKSIRGGDIVARVGGDEFLIFMEYKNPLEPIIRRIYNSLCGPFGDFTISLSMGVAKTEDVGIRYSDLFNAADQALYTIKRGQRGKGAKYVFYNESMADEETQSAISPIDSGLQKAEKGDEDK